MIRIDASKIADCLGCDFLPECHMASTQIRDRRRTLRYRHLLVRQMVQMKNRISGLLMDWTIVQRTLHARIGIRHTWSNHHFFATSKTRYGQRIGLAERQRHDDRAKIHRPVRHDHRR
jgi:hypothetical protein